ncbi:hypothetical protein CBM2586_U20025 [Cupriavidus phytorum]|uniref:Uncharacterized protein n=1 Tax=Cupriavidus taiwanensis TaxID=164546 RepID=A0A375CTB2_9BURK|nr:hypothetical protein CBM2586_U20025 [Cupriavidus taiwanensis]SOZ02672.1 hypothetical protein CBM2600_U10006 [Cupriavidus taiwanensis]
MLLFSYPIGNHVPGAVTGSHSVSENPQCISHLQSASARSARVATTHARTSIRSNMRS